MREVKTFSFFLLAPALVGAFLLITGFGDGSYVKMGIGLLVLGSAPFVARWVWRGGLWE